MKVRLPVLVNDPEVAQYKDIPPVDWLTVEGEDVFLDGPVCRRVAVVDFDPASGALVPGARLVDDGGVAKYDLPPGPPLDHPAFIQASVCGGIFRTLDIFEEADSLGRRVKWAFPGEQLLVVPRAGEWGNAFYERASRSLQLFYVTEPNRRVYAAHSQDIIAHETAHAILDAVAPDLYDAALPQSLAIHEAVADIAMLLSAFRSRKLTDRVREHVGDALERPNAFTQVAEQFGAVVGRGTGGIRDLNNTRTLAEVDATSPHALSEVLSGALYSVMVRIHRELLDATVDDSAPATSLASPAEYRQAAPAPETPAAPLPRRRLRPSRRNRARRSVGSAPSGSRPSASSGRSCARSTTCRLGRLRSSTSVARCSPRTRPRTPTAGSSATGCASSSCCAGSSRTPRSSTCRATSTTQRSEGWTSRSWCAATGSPTASSSATASCSASRRARPSRCATAKT
jgi:hypothetical protein